MDRNIFEQFFQGPALDFLDRAIRTALEEDGPDLTSEALFGAHERLEAFIVAKETTVVAGLPFVERVLDSCVAMTDSGGEYSVQYNVSEGDLAEKGTTLFTLRGPAVLLLKSERVILNFMTHLSGIATLTQRYVQELSGTRTQLLDTRKTLPGLRYPEKYAVLVGGGKNHRLHLGDMLMLKDNHIDRSGSITKAVESLRAAYAPCPPIEVECRSFEDVHEAVACKVERIMLDNMTPEAMGQALQYIPESIETEASGGVSLDTIRAIGLIGPDFVSVGRLTHSAPSADLSMRLAPL